MSTTKYWLLFIFAALTACATPTPRDEQTIKSYSGESADLAVITAKILETVRLHPQADILVAFDLDNTLLAMEQGLGSDQWYSWQSALAEAGDCSSARVSDRLAVQGALYFASAMRPTEPDAAALVRQVQEAGVTTIALTARGDSFRLPTFRELRRNGFNFRDSAFGPVGGFKEAFYLPGLQRSLRYEDGVLMVAGQNKGIALLEVLAYTETTSPDLVILVDDKTYNLENFTQALISVNLPAHTWWYTGEDQNVALFDAQDAELQWQSVVGALQTLESVFGADNFMLPGEEVIADCP